jgi:hypothetical protein
VKLISASEWPASEDHLVAVNSRGEERKEKTEARWEVARRGWMRR